MDTLPAELIHTILSFLPNNTDMLHCLLTNSLFTIPPCDVLKRQQRLWGQCNIDDLAFDGDIKGVQYLLFSFGTKLTSYTTMNMASENGQLAMVQYLHSIGAKYTTEAMNMASKYGHLDVVQFLHSIGAACTTDAIRMAAIHGHVGVLKFLYQNSVKDIRSGRALKDTMNTAIVHGHMAVVQYLHSKGVPSGSYNFDYL